MNDTVLEQHSFGAEVGRLLDLVVHSLYSEREIFLRELGRQRGGRGRSPPFRGADRFEPCAPAGREDPHRARQAGQHAADFR